MKAIAMTNQRKRLGLNRETLRDLTAHNAQDVKAGKNVATLKKKCVTLGCATWDCPANTPMCW